MRCESGKRPRTTRKQDRQIKEPARETPDMETTQRIKRLVAELEQTLRRSDDWDRLASGGQNGRGYSSGRARTPETQGSDVIDMICRQGPHLKTWTSGCDPSLDSLPTVTVAPPQISQHGGRSAFTSVIPLTPLQNQRTNCRWCDRDCVVIVMTKSVRLRGRLCVAVLHSLEA